MTTTFFALALLGCKTRPSAPPAADPIVVKPVASTPPETPAEADAASAPRTCEDGNLDACVARARELRNGPGPTADRARNGEALELFEKACAKDHALACEGVAEMLQDHQYYGGTRDDPTACVLAWDKACRLGNQHACYRLGFYYVEFLTRDLAVDADGRVRKYRRKEDHARGIELMRNACMSGITESCDHLKDALGP